MSSEVSRENSSAPSTDKESVRWGGGGGGGGASAAVSQRNNKKIEYIPRVTATVWVVAATASAIAVMVIGVLATSDARVISQSTALWFQLGAYGTVGLLSGLAIATRPSLRGKRGAKMAAIMCTVFALSIPSVFASIGASGYIPANGMLRMGTAIGATGVAIGGLVGTGVYAQGMRKGNRAHGYIRGSEGKAASVAIGAYFVSSIAIMAIGVLALHTPLISSQNALSAQVCLYGAVGLTLGGALAKHKRISKNPKAQLAALVATALFLSIPGLFATMGAAGAMPSANMLRMGTGLGVSFVILGALGTGAVVAKGFYESQKAASGV